MKKNVFFDLLEMNLGRLPALGLFAFFISLVGTFAHAGDDGKKAVEGKSHYLSYCVNCHGANMVNVGPRSYDLRKFPINAKDRFFKSVKNGKKDMPAWKDILGDGEIEQLWEYVKTRGKI